MNQAVNLDNLSKERLDWLEAFGNQWGTVREMPGTCQACVWGSGRHADSCVLIAEAEKVVTDPEIRAALNQWIEASKRFAAQLERM